MNTNQIVPEMPVVCSQGGQFATVDHLEGKNSIKLNKDKAYSIIVKKSVVVSIKRVLSYHQSRLQNAF